MPFRIKIEMTLSDHFLNGGKLDMSKEVDMSSMRKIGEDAKPLLRQVLKDSSVQGKIRMEFSHTTYGEDKRT